MKFASEQEVFDHIVGALRKQGERSMGISKSNPDIIVCKYRGMGETKCAVGHVIPDDAYSESIEGHTVGRLLDDPRLSHLRPYQSLLISFQGLHDSGEPEEWEAGFFTIAANYELTYTPPAA
jgi:hypothetical protein